MRQAEQSRSVAQKQKAALSLAGTRLLQLMLCNTNWLRGQDLNL